MKYKTIYADPPWAFDDKLDKTRQKPYKTLSVVDLCLLKIKDIVEDQAHLYLWVPSSFLEEAFEVIDQWGFRYKCHIVWEKLTKHGKKWFGMGHYFRHCNELCLFATRGNLKLKVRNIRNSFEAIKPKRHHSAKPIDMYGIIETASYPPFLELFATKQYHDWDAKGYELDGKDVRTYL